MYRILMVDDDPDVLKMNSDYFKKAGYEVLCACNTAQALKITGTVQLDCVVLDIDMPGDDGFEACTRLWETSAVPIIFLSGYGDYDYRIKGFRLGGVSADCGWVSVSAVSGGKAEPSTPGSV